METIRITDETGSEIEFYVLEQTTVSGCDYLLVTEDEDGDADCWILKKITEDGEDVIYEFVEDDDILTSLSKIFTELMEVDFEE